MSAREDEALKPAALSLRGLRRYLDREKSWIYCAMETQGFPKPVKGGWKNSNLWLVPEVDAWLARQRELRDQQQAAA